MDDTSIPTGAIVPVAGTCFDFTTPQAIGARIGEITDPSAVRLPRELSVPPQLGGRLTRGAYVPQGGGYDHNFCIKGDGYGKATHVATCVHEGSGRKMQLYATAPGVQFYTANFLSGVTGKDGVGYEKHHGFCLETQHYPGSSSQIWSVCISLLSHRGCSMRDRHHQPACLSLVHAHVRRGL